MAFFLPEMRLEMLRLQQEKELERKRDAELQGLQRPVVGAVCDSTRTSLKENLVEVALVPVALILVPVVLVLFLVLLAFAFFRVLTKASIAAGRAFFSSVRQELRRV